MNWKIVCYDTLESSTVGGLRAQRLHEFLVGSGVNAEIICPSDKKASGIPNDTWSKLKRQWHIDYSKSWVDELVKSLTVSPDTLLFTTSPPHGIHNLGIKLKKREETFVWVADFRDPFTLNHLYSPSILKKRREGNFEGSVIRHADLVVLNTEQDKVAYQQLYPGFEHKMIYIRNGFDLRFLEMANAKPERQGCVYSGGNYKGTAVLAIEKFLKGLNEKGVSADCHFYGEESAYFENTQFCIYKGKSSQEASLKKLLEYKYGLVYLPEGNRKSGRVAQKFYDYLGAQLIPICLNPSIGIQNIVNEIQRGILVHDESDYNHVVKLFSEGAQSKFLENTVVSPFSREYQFDQLIKVTNERF